ncbi:aminotransferase class I and II domain-containing protein [Ditylenchus destructor]|nr:aminotransferase class I and II domain-containing protein [Ditylenchus destructor]
MFTRTRGHVFVKTCRFISSSVSPARASFVDQLNAELDGIKAAGTYKHERIILGPQGMEITVHGSDKPLLNFCSNNYLGLSSHPELIEESKRYLDKYGAGLSSVRFICGTQDIHRQLESRIAKFHDREDAILYGSCFDANAGVFEVITNSEDAVISDELNHASLIDGIRLSKALRFRYKHMDMNDLEVQLKQSSDCRRRVIVTDGVFSMDGDEAPLKEIFSLARKYNALVLVDECHATGFIGPTGRGTEEACGMTGYIDIINSTLGKAMGGAMGGYTTGPKPLIDLLRQRSRPSLFSNSLAPSVVGSAMKAFELLMRSNDFTTTLKSNVALFRTKMSSLGFKVLGSSENPICPVFLGDAKLASCFADAMLKQGIYVIGFSFPVVPKEKARIRVQISAAHSEKQILRCVDAFETIGVKLNGQHLIRQVLDKILSQDQPDYDAITTVKGEWSVVYLKRDVKKLIFARDIFARKSLCWRVKSGTNGHIFQLSAFPGELSPGWLEVYPGTLFILEFTDEECSSVELNPNKHLNSCLSSQEFSCSLQLDHFECSQLEIVSFFPQESILNNDFAKLFKSVKYLPICGSNLLQPCSTVIAPEIINELLEATVAEFVSRLEDAISGLRIMEAINPTDSIQILFSGGVDSLTIAIVAGRVLPQSTQIVLINVAFGESVEDCAGAPDRQRSIRAFEYLRSDERSLNDACRYRLVLVNVGKKELAECRHKYIAPAIYPSNSVLDDSIGCVLWFASQAKGFEYLNPMTTTKLDHKLHSHIILVGSGADEQLGGYARHRTVYEKLGFDGLVKELAMELSRIGMRNFGRDDRVVSSNGKIVLAPFLEESFVEWLNNVPISVKVDFSLPRGYGEKRLLRRVLLSLGVPPEIASSPKQAMQFGSRIAKLENRNEKGSDICLRLTTVDIE